jgi:rod shape-determining protein MreD
MVRGPLADLWFRRLVFALVALFLFYLRLLPLDSVAGQWPGPDLMLCLVLAWVVRRPEYVPVWLVAGVILMEDMLLQRPPGLWTALVVVASEFLRGRAALMRELNFAVEWFQAALAMLALLLVYRFVFILTLMPQPGFSYAMIQMAATILAYPVMAWISRHVLGVHKPAAGEVDARGRRL